MIESEMDYKAFVKQDEYQISKLKS